MAKTKTGNAWMTSNSRMAISATTVEPPRLRDSSSAMTTPSGDPRSTEIAVAITAITTSVRGAASRRDRMSMPLSSVPSQCAADGGISRSVGEALVVE
jgi:hypothetical protein